MNQFAVAMENLCLGRLKMASFELIPVIVHLGCISSTRFHPFAPCQLSLSLSLQSMSLVNLELELQGADVISRIGQS